MTGFFFIFDCVAWRVRGILHNASRQTDVSSLIISRLAAYPVLVTTVGLPSPPNWSMRGVEGREEHASVDLRACVWCGRCAVGGGYGKGWQLCGLFLKIVFGQILF